MKGLATLWASLALCLSTLPQTASAEAYSYVDKDGQPHFVDSPHLVPEEYRDKTTDLNAAAENESGEFAATLKSQRLAATKILVENINNMRRSQGRRGLSHQQKRELGGVLRKSIPILLICHAVLLIVWLVVLIHGFAQGHPGWAIANLVLFGLPAPIYCVLHIGNEKKPVKVVVSAAAIITVLVLAKTSYDLTSLTMRLSGMS
jgi:hypothetical protein